MLRNHVKRSKHVQWVRVCAIALLWELSQGATAQQAPSASADNAQAQTDEELAERALDRTLVATGNVLLPSGLVEVEPEFLYTRNEQSAPGVFTDTGGAVFVSEQRLNEDLLDAAVQMRLGLPADTQAELYLPYANVREQQVTEVGLVPRADTNTTLSGLGDVNVAIAKTLLVERTGQPNLVARLSWNADTGPTDRALGLSTGTGFNEARLSLLATKRQDPLVFLGGPYYDRSFEQDGERQGDKIGMTVGAALAASPETSLRVVLDQEFDGNREIGGSVQHGSNQTIGILTFGASMTFGAGKFLDLTIQDGLTGDAPKMAIGLGLSWRFDTPWRH